LTARAGRPAILLAGPYLVGVAVLVVAPAVAVTLLAFTEYYGFAPPRYTGLANLERALADPLLARAAVNTALLIALVVPLRLALALGAALLLSRPSVSARFARGAVFAPSTVPESAWALLCLWILNPQFGPVSSVLGSGLGSLTEPWPTRIGLSLVLALQVGETFVVCLAARSLVPPSVYEAAAVEGLGSFATARRVTLPLMAPVVVLLAVRDALLVGTALFVPLLLVTQGGPRESTLTLPLYLYHQAFVYGDLGFAAMVSVLVLAGLVLLALPPAVLSLRRLAPRQRLR
jgi:multiple sugar transport system permease protein